MSTQPSTPADTLVNPVPAGERLGILDAVRGVALGGILLANLVSFFGVYCMDVETRRAMAAGSPRVGVAKTDLSVAQTPPLAPHVAFPLRAVSLG